MEANLSDQQCFPSSGETNANAPFAFPALLQLFCTFLTISTIVALLPHTGYQSKCFPPGRKEKKKEANVTPPLAALWCLIKVSAFKHRVGSVTN